MVNNMIRAFQDAIPVMERIEKAGYEAYFVGGSVRDYLLNKQINDIDIATSATPAEVKAIFSHTIDVGIEHGTVMVIWNNSTYEITTFRTESDYVDYRRPEQVYFVRQLKEDLKRRDFTINALAMDKDGHIYDYFLGKESLKLKEIKTVGNPNERFQEDALRIMRGIRFVSTLGFALEEETRSSMEKNKHLLSKIAVERITNEFEKLLLGTDANKAIKAMIDTKIYKYLPLLSERKEGLMKLSLLALDHLDSKELWATFLICMDVIDKTEIESFLRTWKLAVKQIKDIQKIIFWVKEREAMSFWSNIELYSATLAIATSAEKVYQLMKHNRKWKDENLLELQHSKLAIKTKQELNVTGNDLLTWTNKRQGPWMKEILSQIESAVVEEQVGNDKQLIKEWLVQCHLI